MQSDIDGPLVSMDMKDFIMTVGSRSPSPGGGSVAALCASVVFIYDYLELQPFEATLFFLLNVLLFIYFDSTVLE